MFFSRYARYPGVGCFFSSDDNGISIDGEVEGWFSDDTPKRFEAYGWHVIPAVLAMRSRQTLTPINAIYQRSS
ncbi:hypothetical protein O9993_23030 [Vibrio lentus]|nr:hypothetical protein [Vibrio lentus]